MESDALGGKDAHWVLSVGGRAPGCGMSSGFLSVHAQSSAVQPTCREGMGPLQNSKGTRDSSCCIGGRSIALVTSRVWGSLDEMSFSRGWLTIPDIFSKVLVE